MKDLIESLNRAHELDEAANKTVVGSDVVISQDAEDYFCEGEDDCGYIGSCGTLISHDTATDMCEVEFSDGCIITIPFEYLELN